MTSTGGEQKAHTQHKHKRRVALDSDITHSKEAGRKSTCRDTEPVTEESVKYAIVGIETAANTNTPHLQGFVHFLERKSLAQMKRTFNARAHYEIARGTDKENEKYCTKDGNILLQVGQPASGTTDKGGGFHKAQACAKAAHLLAEGLDIQDLAEEHQEEYEAVLSHSNIIEKHASCLRRREARNKGLTRYCQQPLRECQNGSTN